MASREGFDDFVAERSKSLLRTAFMLGRDWAVAEDLVQEALARAWFAWPRIVGDPEPYVRTILVRSFVSHSRRFWHREVPTEELGDRALPTDANLASDERDALWRALGRLTARQRMAVVLRYYEDLSEADVATLMRCSVGTVKSQTARALSRLRVDPTIAESVPRGEG